MTTHRVPRRRLIGVVGLGCAAATFGAVALAIPAAAGEGEIRGAGAPNAIKNSYIVVLKDGASARSSDRIAARHNATIKHRYRAVLNGYAATMSEADARRTAADPAVAYVEQDGIATIRDTQPNPPSWGLDRIDQRDLPLDKSYTYPNKAAGVTAYILDTGIRTSHQDFGGRASWGTNTTGDGNNSDCNGHGTHVAGTVGGTAYGVAKGVRLIAVKVLNCQGSGAWSGIAAGIDWVTQHHTSGPAVANMSLGGQGSNSTVETAVRNSIADGITYAIASGNSNSDACNFTPARVAEAITVNSTDSNDARSSFSNYGTCTDIFAPGRGITSASHTSDTGSTSMSGTSMAAPHVAGAAALYLEANPSASPATVQTALKDNATKGKVTNPGSGSPNNLLYTGFIGGGDPPPPPPGCSSFSNGTNVDIPDGDNGTPVTSSIDVTNCSGNAPATLKVAVDIKHTWRGDLVIDLVAPDGTAYRLKNADIRDSADNVIATYTVDASSEAANGTWKLRVQDVYRYDTGYVDGWSLGFA